MRALVILALAAALVLPAARPVAADEAMIEEESLDAAAADTRDSSLSLGILMLPILVPLAMIAFGASLVLGVLLVFVIERWDADYGFRSADEIQAARDEGSRVLATWQSIGAVAVALLAPLLGNLADRGGARNTLLRLTTLATVVTVALMPLVALDADYLVLGAALIALAVVFSELAGVFVNSVLPEISTPANRYAALTIGSRSYGYGFK